MLFLTKLLLDPHIPHSCLTILEFWVADLYHFSTICSPALHFALQVAIEMYCSYNVPKKKRDHIYFIE